LQAEIPLNLSHDLLLPLVVVTVTNDGAVESNPICNDVHVLVLGVNVLDDTVLALV